MLSKTILLAISIAYVEARFGQEQIPISAISAVQGGSAGAAATIAGAAVSDLLGAANACAKLIRADQIITELGNGADALAAAIGMVTAEKNTNNFANGNAQNVCADATLPKTEALRGITPLIDPAVDVNGDVNALSASSAAAPLDATGKSVFDLIVDAGFGDLVQGQDSAGGAVAAPASGNAAAPAANGNANANANGNGNADATPPANDAPACAAPADAAPAANETAGAGNATPEAPVASAGSVDLTGVDFGLCTPTITFQAGENGRAADEFTFQIADELARGGQGEALNPNIITNALCNQLTNVCQANDAAVTACLAAKAEVAKLTTRNKAVADTFNTALGFAGFVTNPDGGPADVTAAAAAARRALRLRAVQFRS